VQVGQVGPERPSPLAGRAAVHAVHTLAPAHFTGDDEIPAGIAVLPAQTVRDAGHLPAALSRSDILGGVESIP